MNAVSLELLEHEFASSLYCDTCRLNGLEAVPATHTIVLRATCAWGGTLRRPRNTYLVCQAHADLAHRGVIAPGVHCAACGLDVSGEPYRHVVDRVALIGAPR